MRSPYSMLEDYDVMREERATIQEQTVLDLWRKGLMPQSIADELDMDIDKIEDIIECEENYETLPKL